MQNHLDRLENLCRLCRIKIKSKPRSLIEFKQHVQNLFEYNTDDDTDGKHPKNICDNCRRKLLKTEKENYKKCAIVEFPTHSETDVDDCLVCRSKLVVVPISLIKDKSQNLNVRKLTRLANQFKLLIVNHDVKSFTVTKLDDFDPSHPNSAICSKLVRINLEDSSFNIYVFGKELDHHSHLVYSEYTILDDNNIMPFFNTVFNELTPCAGNDDLDDVIATRISEEKLPSGEIQSFQFSNFDNLNTIRSKSCQLLINQSNKSKKCEQCTTYRKNSLNKIRFRQEKSPEAPSKFTPNVCYTKPQLIQKAAALQKKITNLNKKNTRLLDKITKSMEIESVECSDEDSDFLNEVLTKESCPFGEDTPQSLLWEEQKKMASLKCKNQMRWHPLMIRWCLSIYLKSPGMK